MKYYKNSEPYLFGVRYIGHRKVQGKNQYTFFNRDWDRINRDKTTLIKTLGHRVKFLQEVKKPKTLSFYFVHGNALLGHFSNANVMDYGYFNNGKVTFYSFTTDDIDISDSWSNETAQGFLDKGLWIKIDKPKKESISPEEFNYVYKKDGQYLKNWISFSITPNINFAYTTIGIYEYYKELGFKPTRITINEYIGV